MDSTSGRRNTNPPAAFPRGSMSPFDWDRIIQDGLSDSSLFPMQMSYPSQPEEADTLTVRSLGNNHLDTTYNPVSSRIPEQRTLSKWPNTPTNPPDMMSVGVSSTIPYTVPLASYVVNNEGPWPRQGFFAGPSTLDGRKSQRFEQLRRNQDSYGNLFQTESDPMGSVIYKRPVSDSGYGSMRSVYASSISNLDAGLPATGNRNSFPHGHGFQQTDVKFASEPKVSSSGVSRSVNSLLRCPTCKKVVKTQSALRKHDQRHRKPYICDYPNCPGSGQGQGFGTVNDLDRHIRSKHRERDVLFCHFSGCQEKGRKFTRSDNFGVHLTRCHGIEKDEVKEIIQRKKEQQRLGNHGEAPHERNSDIQIQDARQDISFHAMEQSNESLVVDDSQYEMYDLDDQGPVPEDIDFYQSANQSRDLEDKATPMLEQSKYRPAGSQDMEYLSGMEPNFEPVDFIMDTTLDISESATPVATTTTGATPMKANMSDINALTDPHAQRVLASALAHKRSKDLRKSKGMGISHKQLAPVGRRIDTPTLSSRKESAREDFNPGDVATPDSKDEECHTDSQDDENAATILRDIKSRGFELRRNVPLLSPSTPNAPSSSPSTPPLSCPTCSKTCRRPSEMAKHMKRHSRPYSCTFPPCTKTFGSKNDWRRHENSQHLHYESWHCTLDLSTTTSTSTTTLEPQDQDQDQNNDEANTCKHISYHLDAFKSHLSRTHSIPQPSINAHATRARRLLPTPSTFHCGFCPSRIAQPDWSARFDHLDAHFTGRGGSAKVSMAAWKAEGVNPQDESQSRDT
ncbi:hypothetical protein O988_06384 [Pseudogymnoascus sp. VKM F-3808]|nr:hypothetical protein O988_06384 [Pseudogymnoascus sp. VKM F-3808]